MVSRRNFLKMSGTALAAVTVTPADIMASTDKRGERGSNNLKFRADGKFKIVQFTDTHFQPHNSASDAALKVINEALDEEKPDLVIFTGDVVTEDPADGWPKIMKPIILRSIPFAVAFGNHDHECGMKRSEVADIVTAFPYNLNTKEVKGVTGYLNDVLTVEGRDGKPAFALYCMDSNAYSTIDNIDGYGWFTDDQIDWYIEQSNRLAKKNGGKPLPSLSFFHIPLPEYRIAFDQPEKWKRTGKRMEKECAPQLNTGMFYRMMQQNDMVGMFTGHDHDNDYVVNYVGIALAYGRFSGGKTTYTNRTNGSRVIELTEGIRGFESWIRLNGGKVKDRARFPQDY